MNVSLQPTNYYFLEMLTALINPALAAPTLLAAAKMMLGQNFFSPSLNTVYSNLSECDFVGYAQSATIAWGVPVNDVDTTPTSIAPSHQFRATSAATPNNVQSLAVTDGVAPTATGILASGAFAPPITIANIGDGFAVIVDWNLGNVPGSLTATIIQ